MHNRSNVILALLIDRCPYTLKMQYVMAPSGTYCVFDYRSREQLGLSLFVIAHGTIVLNIIIFCYYAIYRKYKAVKKNVDKNVSAIETTDATTKHKSHNTEFRILMTVSILAIWTSIGKFIMITND